MNFIRSLFANDGLDKVYLSEVLRGFAFSMVSVFVPLYLIRQGYSLYDVLFFFIISSFVHIALVVPVGKFGSAFGFRYCILASIPFILVFYYLLSTIAAQAWPLALLAVVQETGNAFYWVGRHVFFARTTETHKRGVELGVNKILQSIFTAPSPLIGGLILAVWGIGPLMVAASLLLLLSVAPLFFVREPRGEVRFEARELARGQTWRTIVMFANQGVDNIMDDVAWSIYAFFNILKKYVIFGALQVVSAVFSLAVDYGAGRLTDAKGRRALQAGGLMNLFVWAFRYLAKTNLQVYAIDSARGVSGEFIQVAFGATSYELASRSRIVPFIVFREIIVHCGKLLGYGFILLVGLKTSFILGAAYSLVYIFVRYEAA